MEDSLREGNEAMTTYCVAYLLRGRRPRERSFLKPSDAHACYLLMSEVAVWVRCFTRVTASN